MKFFLRCTVVFGFALMSRDLLASDFSISTNKDENKFILYFQNNDVPVELKEFINSDLGKVFKLLKDVGLKPINRPRGIPSEEVFAVSMRDFIYEDSPEIIPDQIEEHINFAFRKEGKELYLFINNDLIDLYSKKLIFYRKNKELVAGLDTFVDNMNNKVFLKGLLEDEGNLQKNVVTMNNPDSEEIEERIAELHEKVITFMVISVFHIEEHVNDGENSYICSLTFVWDDEGEKRLTANPLAIFQANQWKPFIWFF